MPTTDDRTRLEEMGPEARRKLGRELDERFEAAKSKRLALDMTRGKPSPEQLDLADGLLAAVTAEDVRSEEGTDCRNYGGLEGLPEARRLFAELLEVAPHRVLIGGNASLSLMHDLVAQGLLRTLPGGEQPWGRAPVVRFLCPSPGYDRHFSICEYLGIEMIPVPIGEDGPEMEEVERRVAEDETIKGMFCVPKYSNPTGVTYSDEVVRALARMKTRANDFRIFWDNAYAVHHLFEPLDRLENMLEACEAAGHPDRVFVFGSTSKIGFAGAGIGAVASSERNVGFVRQYRSKQTIGPDKLNQLRHVRFFGDRAGIESHMKRHAEILRPRFETVLEVLEEELGGYGVATWTRPRGGYFISLDVADGCAGEVVAMAASAGVKLTAAGATFPYGRDPRDRNIRIAPSFPSIDELREATRLLGVCVLRTCLEKR